MNYGICSDSWLFWCTIQVLHLVPMMQYILHYFGLLFLYLVEIAVWDWNQNLHRYICKLIGGYEVLIAGVYLELLLLAVKIFPTIGGGSLCIHCIFPLWSGSWTPGLISIIFFPWYCLEEPTGNWYPWLAWPVLALLVFHFPLYGTLGWFHSFSIILSILWNHVSSPCCFCSSFHLLEWGYNHVHTLHRFIYFLCCMWLGSVC